MVVDIMKATKRIALLARPSHFMVALVKWVVVGWLFSLLAKRMYFERTYLSDLGYRHFGLYKRFSCSVITAL